MPCLHLGYGFETLWWYFSDVETSGFVNTTQVINFLIKKLVGVLRKKGRQILLHGDLIGSILPFTNQV